MTNVHCISDYENITMIGGQEILTVGDKFMYEGDLQSWQVLQVQVGPKVDRVMIKKIS